MRTQDRSPLFLLFCLYALFFVFAALAFNTFFLEFFSADRKLADTTRRNIHYVQLWFLVWALLAATFAYSAERWGFFARMRSRERVVNSTITVSIIIFLCIVLELTLGVVFTSLGTSELKLPAVPENEYQLYEFDELLGWRNKPYASSSFAITDSTTFVSINSLGMRETENYERGKKKQRILVLGDSFAWGFGVEQTERFSDLLRDMLGNRFEIMNAGVSGYGIDQEYLYFKERGADFKPDIVMVLFGLDDASDTVKREGKPYFTLEEGELLLHNVPVPVPAQIEGRGKSVHEAGFFERTMNLSNTYRFLVKKVLRAYNQRTAHPLAKDILRTFAQHVTSQDTRFLVVLKPDKALVREDYNSTLYREYHDLFLNLGIEVINPLDALQQRNLTSPVFFEHDGHWNPEGHRVVAEQIAETIRQ